MMGKMQVLLLLACFVAIQLVLLSSPADALSKRAPPKEVRLRKVQKTNKVFGDKELKELRKKVEPKPDKENVKSIKQPPGAGKTTKKFRSQVVGGNEATLGQFPWQVYITVDYSAVCGGSLFLSNWVMTTAQCSGGSYEVYLGSIVRSSPSAGHVYLESTESYTHEQFDFGTLNNDIAVIKLPSDVTFTDNIALVALPTIQDATNSFEGTLASLSGFGKTTDTNEPSDSLQFVDVSVISNENCAIYYGDAAVTSGTICTNQITKAACQGDGGSPLVYKDPSNTWVQLGISSFVPISSCLAGPSAYVRISSYLGWMSEKIGQNVAGTTPIGGGGGQTTTPGGSGSNPAASSSSPPAETSTPLAVTSTQPAVTTIPPAETTTPTAVTTTPPPETTTPQAATTTAPAETTTPPAETTTAPADTTTAAPATTTQKTSSTKATGKTTKGKPTTAPKTTTTTTPKSTNCASFNFDLLKTNKCCKDLTKNIVTYDKNKDKSCSGASEATFKFFNSFLLNKHQDVKSNNTIKFNDAKIKTALSKPAGVMNCYLKNKGVIVNNVIDRTKLVEFYSNAVGSNVATFINTVVTECHDYVNNNVGNSKCLNDLPVFDHCSKYVFQSRETREKISKGGWTRDKSGDEGEKRKSSLKNRKA